MAKTYQKKPDKTIDHKRSELIEIIGKACWFEGEWKHLCRTITPSKQINIGVAEVSILVARSGAFICRQIMCVAVVCLQELERGEIEKAAHSLRICKRLIGADITASKILEKLIGGTEVGRG